MTDRKKSNVHRSKIFSILNSDVICEHRNDMLPHISNTPFHNHDGYEILLFLNGTANYFVETEGKYLQRGEIILTSPYAFHCTDANEDAKYERIFINIKEGYMRNLCSEYSDLSKCFHDTAATVLNHLLLSEDEIIEFTNISEKLRYELYHPVFGSDLFIQALLIELLILINRKSSNTATITYQSTMPKIVSDTISFININLQNELTMEMIANHLHHNPDYLSRRFKDLTGTNIQQFIIAKRLTLAQKYLREGKSVSESCLLSGFSDYSNFSRSFSRHFEISPKQYQQNCLPQKLNS